MTQKRPQQGGRSATSGVDVEPKPSSPEGQTEVGGILSTSHEERVAALSACYERAMRRGDRRAAAALFDSYLIVARIAWAEP